MTKYRESKAPATTSTYDRSKLKGVDNIYEAISIISKDQLNNINIRKKLHEKLDEFVICKLQLRGNFENKEQIEVSKFYESLPKPHALAIEEWFKNKIYHRNTDEEV